LGAWACPTPGPSTASKVAVTIRREVGNGKQVNRDPEGSGSERISNRLFQSTARVCGPPSDTGIPDERRGGIDPAPLRPIRPDRRAEAAEAESIDAAPVEERRRALPHELNLLLVLQRREQRGDPLGTGERRQAAAADAAVVDELRRLRQVATAPDQPLGPQQVVHLRRVERVLTGPVLGPVRRILAAVGQPAVAD